MLTYRELKSRAEVEEWFGELLNEFGLNFHPDELAESYVSCETGEHCFDRDECEAFDRMMGEAFDVLGEDVYEAGIDAFRLYAEGMEGARM